MNLKQIVFLWVIFVPAFIFAQSAGSAKQLCERLKFSYPEHGFVSAKQASKWEESMITGNGTIGALIPGYPQKETIILSHEKLFMPEYPPTKAPAIGKHLSTIREYVLNGQGEKAADLAVELGKQAGIDELIWTDPLVPACQLEIESLEPDSVINYARSVDYETGEAITAWETPSGVFHRRMFISRPDSIGVVKISSPTGNKLNLTLGLNQLPAEQSERTNDIEDEFNFSALIEKVDTSINDNGLLTYTTKFRKKWTGSLKGFTVQCKIITNGEFKSGTGRLDIKNADEILILSNIDLSYELPVKEKTTVEKIVKADYNNLLQKHAAIHSEMFHRFELKLTDTGNRYFTSEELLASSSFGNMNKRLVEQICKAARYTLICSTGEIPPTLQGIWGGTWRPAWSGDFTLNGNVPSVLASGFNSNFIEIMDSYANYMFSMFDDFKANARDVYGADGVFVLSRTSSSGKTYHYLSEYPHMFWFAGSAWTSHFFYDYWQYTGDTYFLKNKAIPFMLASAEFYKDILFKNENGQYMFVPSYSPEIGPIGHHPVVINAVMDIASLKQLLRNLLRLADEGWISKDNVAQWRDILDNLPAYEVDETGDLKEWIYPGLKNNNEHRHASHLYPLFYQVDPEFENNAGLVSAARTAIENRLSFRRKENGGVMAFGLVQIGLAAAHLPDPEHAFECVDWLCHSYWTPAFTSYHDPGEIFNVDICGGLPSVVVEMLVQSKMDNITLLPALPKEWPDGSVNGVRARGGFVVDLEWKDHKLVKVKIKSLLGHDCKLTFQDQSWDLKIVKGETIIREF